MTRYLTPKEIDTVIIELCTSCPFKDITKEVQTRIQEYCKKQLDTVKIYPELIPQLTTELMQQFISSQVHVGESVGILSAQSIGERQTQMTLNSFHTSGLLNTTVVTGVPRFEELLRATKNPKGTTTKIYFTNKYSSYTECRNDVEYNLLYIQMIDIIKYVRKSVSDKPWTELYLRINDISLEHYKPSLSIQLDLEKLYSNRIELQTLTTRILEDLPHIIVIQSPSTIGKLDIWISENSDEDVLYDIEQVVIKGIEGLTDIYYSEDSNGEWYAEMTGCNLRMLFTHPIVDKGRTFSNHMLEIYEVLGVEASREFLIREFIYVISTDSYMNIRHIQLLVDIMTFTGNITSISRYGVQRNQSGPLTKASFEETLDNFLKAGMYGDLETTNGVSASIICGKPSRIGTGICDLLYSPIE